MPAHLTMAVGNKCDPTVMENSQVSKKESERSPYYQNCNSLSIRPSLLSTDECVRRAAIPDVILYEAFVIYHYIISASVSLICLKLCLININMHFSNSGSCEIFLVIMNEPYFSFMPGLTLLEIDDNISDRIDFFLSTNKKRDAT